MLTDSVLETFGQRKVGSYTIVLDPDGTRRVVETFVQGRPWHHDPPAGTAHTTLEEQKRLQRTISSNQATARWRNGSRSFDYAAPPLGGTGGTRETAKKGQYVD